MAPREPLPFLAEAPGALIHVRPALLPRRFPRRNMPGRHHRCRRLPHRRIVVRQPGGGAPTGRTNPSGGKPEGCAAGLLLGLLARHNVDEEVEDVGARDGSGDVVALQCAALESSSATATPTAPGMCFASSATAPTK